MTIEPLSAIRARVKIGTPDYITAPSASPEPAHEALTPFLSYHGGVHWQCRDIISLIATLRAAGFIDLATEKPNELARLWTQQHGCIICKSNGWLTARGQAMVLLDSIKKAGR